MPLFAVEYTYTAETALGRDTHRAAHRAWLATLVECGTVLTCGPYTDDSGALVLVDSDTAETVRSLVADDPFVADGLVPHHRIMGWTPVLGCLADARARPGEAEADRSRT
ncbi:YciI family protein [Rhodococcus sp. CSLK01-03]|uniref:YciI family protein n=1 Tax=Rhodococcus indonesiensis TaxID=3055869 RepID=A0ABT7RQ41_9NOCA|nr:YciI family protein [Rhodococcus indonesiensis]MDM7489389.1 YciI family protein [Rhodococcus indonesiensis]